MKITKMKVKGFKGIREERMYDFSSPVSVLWGNNGDGKTSAVEAFRFGLTGLCPEDAVNAESNMASVSIEIGDDTIERIVFLAEGSRKATTKLNGKRVAIKDANQYLADRAGVEMSNIQTITSSELMHSMEKELGDFFLSYVQTVCNKADILQWLVADTDSSHIHEEDIDEVKGFLSDLPDEQVSWKDIVGQQKRLYEERRILKKQGKEKQVLFQSLNLSGADIDLETVRLRLDEVNEKIGRSKANENLLRSWEEQQKNRANILKKIEVLQKEADSILAKQGGPTLQELRSKRETLNKTLNSSISDYGKVCKDIDWLQSIRANLLKGVCPLSSPAAKVICTTNLDGAKKEVEERLRKGQDQKKLLDANIRKMRSDLAEMDKDLESIHAQKMNVQKKRMLLDQIEALKESLPPQTNRPEVDVQDYSAVKRELMQKQELAQQWQKGMILKAEIHDLAHKVWILEDLNTAFTKKGCIYERVIGMYIDRLTQAMESLKKTASTKLEIKFVNSNGLKCLFKTGKEDWRSYSLLSSGEKMMALFLVSNLCNRLSGLKILIMDNLDALDDRNLDSFLSMIDENSKDYDNILVAGVDHAGTKEIIQKYNVRFV